MLPPPKTTRWTVCLLGQFRLERDGQVVVQLGITKPDLLLAYLALKPRTFHLRSEIAQTFWPDQSVSRARQTLSLNLFLLRRHFASHGLDEAIRAGRSDLSLNPEIGTDVQLFDQLVLTAVHASDPRRRQRLFEEALALYGDGLLPSFQFPWVAPERHRLEALHRSATEQLAGSVARGQMLLNVSAAAWRQYRQAAESASPGTEAGPAPDAPWPAGATGGEARAMLLEQLAQAEAAEDLPLAAATRVYLASTELAADRDTEAETYAREALAIIQANPDARQESAALRVLGQVASRGGDNAAALDFFRRSLEAARTTHDLREIGEVTRHLADAQETAGDDDAAAASYRQAASLLDASGEQASADRARHGLDRLTGGRGRG